MTDISDNNLQILKNRAVDNAAECIFLTDASFNLIYINRKCAELFGYESEDEVLGEQVWNLFDASPALDAVQKKVQEQDTAEVQLRITFGSGETQSVDLRMSPLPANDVTGKGLIWEGILIKTNAALRAVSQTFFEEAPDGILIVDEDGRIQKINKQIRDMLGHTEKGLLGEPIEKLIPQNEGDNHHLYHKKNITSPPKRSMRTGMNYWLLNKQGKKIPVDIKVQSTRQQGEQKVITIIREDTQTEEMREKQHFQKDLDKLLEVSKLANRADDLKQMCRESIEKICQFIDWPAGHLYLPANDGTGEFYPSDIWHLEQEETFEPFRKMTRCTRFAPGVGMVGEVISSRQPQWYEDLPQNPAFVRRLPETDLEFKTCFGLPMVAGGRVFGVMEFFTPESIPVQKDLLNTLKPMAHLVGLAAQRIQKQEEFEELKELNDEVFIDDLIPEQEGKEQNANSDTIEILKQSGEEFKPLNRLAAYICGTSVSLVNLLDQNFQYVASKTGDWEGHTTPKEHTVCQFTVQEDEILVINDTREDHRTSSIKEIADNEALRFYAGVPIKSPNGTRIGAFCVIDETPQELSQDQRQALIDLGNEVEARINLLKEKKNVETKNKKLQQSAAFLENSTDILWVLEPITFRIQKSKGVESILGCTDEEVIGKSLFNIIEEINIQNHIKQWTDQQSNHTKLGIPVHVNIESADNIWLNLTFTKYNDSILATGRDITKQQIAEEQLRESLEEKKILLSEVHHRVKNNLAVISGLLQLERFQAEDENIIHVLRNSESRVISIAKIHELLYQSHDFANVQMEQYVNNLVTHLQDSYLLDDQNINIDLKIADFQINVNQALPVGLIVNELVANSIEHAFSKQDLGTITVLIIEDVTNEITVEVRDNGKGLDMNVSEFKEKGNLGSSLIQTLTSQLNADLEITIDNGTTFRFSFQKEDKKGSVSAL